MAIGKRTKMTREGVDPAKAYPLEQAVKMVKERAKAKFDETIEVAMNLGVDPRHADQMVRGVVSLPNGSGRSVRPEPFGNVTTPRTIWSACVGSTPRFIAISMVSSNFAFARSLTSLTASVIG